ncbi:MAG: GMC family oxidoreductase [Bryobacterales bacterium]|nr:GMC family oxidoreductase [Bryobacterales bacterium]
MSLPKVNAVIVGAGAGGGVVARELAEAGLSVVLLERGRWVSPTDCRKDDLRNQRTSPLGHTFGPEDGLHPRVVIDPAGNRRIVQPSEGGYQNNAACVGSGTVSYGAMAWRFMPQDFRMRTHYGVPPGSTLDDWPISYDDLEPYYDKAEWEMGVSGDVDPDPFKGPRRRGLPMPPLSGNRECEILRAAAKRLGWHPFDVPMLRNSVPYNGRQACMRCRWCVGHSCEVDAKNGTQNTVIPRALATGNCVLRTGCMTKQILMNGARATGVSYFDERGRLEEQPADIVVVAAAAVETARLLLNSKTAMFPQGLGNRYDWVGRNLQGHSYCRVAGTFEQVVYDDLGPGSGIAICDFAHHNAGIAGGAMLTNEFLRSPIQFVEKTKPGVPRWGLEHKRWMRQNYVRHISVGGPVQEIPVWESRVEVDPAVKDAWGIPVARISGGKHEKTVETARAMAAKCEVWMKEAGALTTWPTIPNRAGTSGGQHQAGTARMGNDPKTSVVNRACQVHEIDNLFVADGSVHVTNGAFNPALTILANAYRVGEGIARLWKGSGLR